MYGVWAFPLTYVTIALASTGAFLIARYQARDRIRELLNRRRKYRAIDKAVASEGWQIVVLLRLSPVVPFNLQNYAPASPPSRSGTISAQRWSGSSPAP